MKYIISAFFVLYLVATHQAQAQTDSVQVDSITATIRKDVSTDTLEAPSFDPDSIRGLRVFRSVNRFFISDYPNPKKAALFSLVLPGSGQAYNGKWWKIPIVYAGLGALTYIEVNNITTYRLYKKSYKNLVDGDPATVVEDPKLQLQDRVTMKANRDTARKNLEQSSLILGLGYLLSVTDAFVDAHLASFDVSDDLTLRLKAHGTAGYAGFSLVLSAHP